MSIDPFGPSAAGLTTFLRAREWPVDRASGALDIVVLNGTTTGLHPPDTCRGHVSDGHRALVERLS